MDTTDNSPSVSGTHIFGALRKTPPQGLRADHTQHYYSDRGRVDHDGKPLLDLVSEIGDESSFTRLNHHTGEVQTFTKEQHP